MPDSPLPQEVEAALRDIETFVGVGPARILRAALATPAQPVPSGLDVDVLREAIDSAMTDDEVPWSERPRPAQVATEYARLAALDEEKPHESRGGSPDAG